MELEELIRVPREKLDKNKCLNCQSGLETWYKPVHYKDLEGKTKNFYTNGEKFCTNPSCFTFIDMTKTGWLKKR